MCQITGNVESAYFFLGVNTQNFSSASNREFSQSAVNQVRVHRSLKKSPFTCCRSSKTGRDLSKRARMLDIWVLSYHWNRKHSPIIVAFSRRIALKSGIFNDFWGAALHWRTWNDWKKKPTPKKITLSFWLWTDSVWGRTARSFTQTKKNSV